MTDYAAAKAERDALEQAASRVGALLRGMATGPAGMTPDAVKATAEWRGLRLAYSQAFGRLQRFNAVFCVQHRNEIRAERNRTP